MHCCGISRHAPFIIAYESLHFGSTPGCSSPSLHFGKDFNILSHYSRGVYFPRRLIKVFGNFAIEVISYFSISATSSYMV